VRLALDRRVAVLALAVVAYAIAAWAVAPGFYDGIAPPQPYRWVSPPPQLRASNQQPQSGQASVKVTGGVVDPGSAFAQDGQAALAFIPGAFQTPPDRSPVTITIKPVATFPDPGPKLRLATNVYCFTSSSPLAPGKDVLVTLQYSDQMPPPVDIYESENNGPWKKLGNTGNAAPFYIAVRATSLGCFAGGYDATAGQTAQGTRVGGGQTLPILVAVAILVVVLAGVPLAVLRRRESADEEEEEGGA
jgi:hypothetical protein